MPVRSPERWMGGVAPGGGGAVGDARAGAQDQLCQGRHEAPRLALAHRRILRRLGHIRCVLLRRQTQRQQQVLLCSWLRPSIRLTRSAWLV